MLIEPAAAGRVQDLTERHACREVLLCSALLLPLIAFRRSHYAYEIM